MLHWEEHSAGETFDKLYRRRRHELVNCVIRQGTNPQEAEDMVQTTFLRAYQAALAGAESRSIEARGATTMRRLVEAVGRLQRSQRDVLLLREIGGHSYSEIGRRLGVTIGGVQLLLFRARRMLRREFSEERKGVGALIPLPWPQFARSLMQHLDGVGPAAVAFKGAVIGAAIATAWVAAPPNHAPSTPSRAVSAPVMVTHLSPRFANALVVAGHRSARVSVVAPQPVAPTERAAPTHVKPSSSREIGKTAAPWRQASAAAKRLVPPETPAGLPPQRNSVAPSQVSATTTTAPQPVSTSTLPVADRPLPLAIRKRPSTASIRVPGLPQIPAPPTQLPAAIATLVPAAVNPVSESGAISAETAAVPQSVALPAPIAPVSTDDAVSAVTAAAPQLAAVPSLPPSLP